MALGKKFQYLDGSELSKPVTLQELKALRLTNRLRDDTKVWHEPTQRWMKYIDFAALMDGDSTVETPSITTPSISIPSISIPSTSIKSSWLRWGIRGLLLFTLVCFVFPFLTISCGTMEYQYSGVEALVGFEVEDEETSFEPTLILAVAAIGAAIYFSFKERKKVTAILCGIACVLFILFRIGMGVRLSLRLMGEDADFRDAVELDFNAGWWLSTLSSGAATGIAFYMLKFDQD